MLPSSIRPCAGFPCTSGHVSLSSWCSLVDCCSPPWTDLLPHLISCNMLLSDSWLFHVSMSLCSQDTSHPASFLLYLPLRLIHVENICSSVTSVQHEGPLRERRPDPFLIPTSSTGLVLCHAGSLPSALPHRLFVMIFNGEAA